MRRKVGISGLQGKQKQQESFSKLGNEVKTLEVEKMREQVKVFKEKLEEYAIKHQKDINSNAELRKHFHEMCSAIGVDPLQSTKGFWSELLGIGNFYYELAVQIVDLSYQTRPF